MEATARELKTLEDSVRPVSTDAGKAESESVPSSREMEPKPSPFPFPLPEFGLSAEEIAFEEALLEGEGDEESGDSEEYDEEDVFSSRAARVPAPTPPPSSSAQREASIRVAFAGLGLDVPEPQLKLILAQCRTVDEALTFFFEQEDLMACGGFDESDADSDDEEPSLGGVPVPASASGLPACPHPPASSSATPPSLPLSSLEVAVRAMLVDSLGAEITAQQLRMLCSRVGSVDAAVDYYFSNPELFS